MYYTDAKELDGYPYQTLYLDLETKELCLLVSYDKDKNVLTYNTLSSTEKGVWLTKNVYNSQVAIYSAREIQDIIRDLGFAMQAQAVEPYMIDMQVFFGTKASK